MASRQKFGSHYVGRLSYVFLWFWAKAIYFASSLVVREAARDGLAAALRSRVQRLRRAGARRAVLGEQPLKLLQVAEHPGRLQQRRAQLPLLEGPLGDGRVVAAERDARLTNEIGTPDPN